MGHPTCLLLLLTKLHVELSEAGWQAAVQSLSLRHLVACLLGLTAAPRLLGPHPVTTRVRVSYADKTKGRCNGAGYGMKLGSLKQENP